MEWENKVSVEGLATAIGVLGTAVGFLINLIRTWRRDADEKAMRGVSFVIIEMLEENLVEGLSEQELFDAYTSERRADLRKKYSAKKPSKLSQVDFERRLRILQFEGMVDPVAKDRWRVRARPVDRHEIREYNEATTRRLLRDAVPAGDIVAAAEGVLSEASTSWQKKQALQLLIRLRPEEAAVRLKGFLKSADPEESLAAAEIIAEVYM
jgi:hypothetical protein